MRQICSQNSANRGCIACDLEHQGPLQGDAAASYSDLSTEEGDPTHQLLGHFITDRSAVGPNQGRKVFTLQSLPLIDEPPTGIATGGFLLHTGVAAGVHQCDKLERLVRYIARLALSEKRLSLTEYGTIRDHLKTPYRDGTTHSFFEPLDFSGRLAALIPHPRVLQHTLPRCLRPYPPTSRRDHTGPTRPRQARALPSGRRSKTPAASRAAMT